MRIQKLLTALIIDGTHRDLVLAVIAEAPRPKYLSAATVDLITS